MILTQQLRQIREWDASSSNTAEASSPSSLSSSNISYNNTAAIITPQRHLPILSSREARILWKSDAIVRKGIRRVNNDNREEDSGVGLVEFMQLLLLHYHILVPIDANLAPTKATTQPITLPQLYFIPSLINTPIEEEPSLLFSYKCVEFWKGCLSTCYSVDEGMSDRILQRVTGIVLRDVYAASRSNDDLKLQVLQIHCWKGAFSLLVSVTDEKKVVGVG